MTYVGLARCPCDYALPTMKPQPDDDPTAEEEIPEFDGTSTDQLGDRYRIVVAVASEAASSSLDATKPAVAADLHVAIPTKESDSN